MARKPKAKPRPKKEENHKPAFIGIFFCGLIAVAYGVVEGFIFQSSVVMTGSSGTYSMDKITSSLMIIAGLIGMGFAVWAWFTSGKKS